MASRAPFLLPDWNASRHLGPSSDLKNGNPILNPEELEKQKARKCWCPDDNMPTLGCSPPDFFHVREICLSCWSEKLLLSGVE